MKKGLFTWRMSGTQERFSAASLMGELLVCCEELEVEYKLLYINRTDAFDGKRLTYDHRAEDECEVKRINEAGGFIARSRVLGILAVSRSFGDHGMKDFVIADPYLSQTRLSDYKETPFLILACDGVWDVMTDLEGAMLILEAFRNNGGPFEDAAKLLVRSVMILLAIAPPILKALSFMTYCRFKRLSLAAVLIMSLQLLCSFRRRLEM